MKKDRALLCLSLTVLFSLLLGCSNSSSSSAPITVTVAASHTAVDQSQTVNLTATVANDSKAAGVTWSLSGAGSLSNQTTSSASYVAPDSVVTKFTATITATSVSDTGKEASVQITVNPLPTITTQTMPTATAGVVYGAAITCAGGTAPFSWSVIQGTLPAGLYLGSSTSSSVAISGMPTVQGGSGIVVQVTDVFGNSSTQNLTINVNPPAPLVITTTTLPAATIGTAYAAPVSATGGIPAYTWSLSGQPAWLNINSSTGVLSGTPTGTSAGTVSFTVTVTDSQTPTPATAVAGLSIAVNIATLKITTTSLPAATVNASYSTTVSATGGIAPYLWSLSNAPSWLSINSSTGVLSGTAPTQAGVTPTFAVQVQDSEGPPAQAVSANFTITINSAQACSGTLNNSLLSGNYAFLMNGWSGSTTASSEVGSMVADGNGNITSGVFDAADQAKSAPQNMTLTGTYCVGSDNVAIVTLTPSGGSSGTFAAGLDAQDGNGYIMDYETNGKMLSGLLRKQTPSAFSTSSINGKYAFGMVGADRIGESYATVGEFSSNGTGSFNGLNDINDGGLFQPLGSFTSTGLFSVSATTGRATVGTTSGTGFINMVLYVVNSSELLMMAVDTATPAVIMGGQVLEQSNNLSNSTLNGAMVYATQFLDGATSPGATVGLLTASNGTFSGSFDENDGGTLSTQTPSGNYSVNSSTGRVTLSGAGNNPPVFYLVGANQAFLLGTGATPDFGALIPQTGSSFTTSSISGVFVGGTEAPVSWIVDTEVDSVDANTGSITGTQYVNDGTGGTSSGSITGSYCTATSGTKCTSSSTGRAIGTCPAGSVSCTPGALEQIIYIVSDSQFVSMDARSGNTTPRLMDFHH